MSLQGRKLAIPAPSPPSQEKKGRRLILRDPERLPVREGPRKACFAPVLLDFGGLSPELPVRRASGLRTEANCSFYARSAKSISRKGFRVGAGLDGREGLDLP